jgi:ribonuclease HI
MLNRTWSYVNGKVVLHDLPKPPEKIEKLEQESRGYEIFGDGACDPNPGSGGWGVIIRNEDGEVELSGGEVNTTNNRMELMAVIVGLEYIKTPSKVVVVSDSTYVVKGASEWLPGWKKRGWRRSAKTPLLNCDLWRRLDAAAAPHRVRWQWVRGHNGHPENERADCLATMARPGFI